MAVAGFSYLTTQIGYIMAFLRKGWDNLSESMRKRYLSHGVTRDRYEGGVSLAAARGHQNTDNTPGEVLKFEREGKWRVFDGAYADMTPAQKRKTVRKFNKVAEEQEKLKTTRKAIKDSGIGKKQDGEFQALSDEEKAMVWDSVDAAIDLQEFLEGVFGKEKRYWTNEQWATFQSLYNPVK